jgi:hypothetical protein
MLRQLLQRRGINTRVLAGGVLAGESIDAVTRESPAVVCVLGVPPLGYAHARYLCRRLKSTFPELKLVGGFLTEADVNLLKRRQPPLVADEVASSLRDAVAAVLSLAPLTSAPAAQNSLVTS